MDDTKKNLEPVIEPETPAAQEEDEATLPEVDEEVDLAQDVSGFAAGREAIARATKLAPSAPGVYRMIAG